MVFEVEHFADAFDLCGVGGVDAAEHDGSLPGGEVDDDVVGDVGGGGLDAGDAGGFFGGVAPVGHGHVTEAARGGSGGGCGG